MTHSRMKKQPGREESSSGQKSKRKSARPSTIQQDDSDSRGRSSPSKIANMPQRANNIYNRNAPEAPAELFRKDLISAMKLPDNEPLSQSEYWILGDSWKQEWERGVQVPVNPESLPESSVTVSSTSSYIQDFKLPKNKFIRTTNDDFYNPEIHQMSSAPARANKVCSYDMDDLDDQWLRRTNGERALQGLSVISELTFERVVEEYERQCALNMRAFIKSEDGLGIEYDESVICDVCRAPDCEDGNEMVFCDSCNICVHQACYGITTIPSGNWLCKACSLALKPSCALCPNKGGAMKTTQSGNKWAHVACALWVPEVSIGCVEKMEPITKISDIPQSRWALVCVLCRERQGACIQCSVKSCKTAYHVTCAFKHGLEMKAIIEDENSEDGVKLKSYCLKHSVNKKPLVDGPGHDPSPRKAKKDMTPEERKQAKAEKMCELEAEFFKHAGISEASKVVNIDYDVCSWIFSYWVLKRKSGGDKPLLPHRVEETEVLTQQQQQDVERMKMFLQLRQDLERVRNLCYMVNRREKLSRSYIRMREQTFTKQSDILSNPNLSTSDALDISEMNHAPNVFDKMYSAPYACSFDSPEFESMLERLSSVRSDFKTLRKQVNGKHPLSASLSSITSMTSDSEREVKRARSPLVKPKTAKNAKQRKEQSKMFIDESSTEADNDPPKKTAAKLNNIYTDSEEELKENQSKSLSKNGAFKTKAAMKEFENSSKTLARKKPTARPPVDADSDENDNLESETIAQRKVGKKGKAPVKSKVVASTKVNTSPKKRVSKVQEKASDKIDLKDFIPYVPQRQAARKAAETIKITGFVENDKPIPPATVVPAAKKPVPPVKDRPGKLDSSSEDESPKKQPARPSSGGAEKPFRSRGPRHTPGPGRTADTCPPSRGAPAKSTGAKSPSSSSGSSSSSSSGSGSSSSGSSSSGSSSSSSGSSSSSSSDSEDEKQNKAAKRVEPLSRPVATPVDKTVAVAAPTEKTPTLPRERECPDERNGKEVRLSDSDGEDRSEAHRPGAAVAKKAESESESGAKSEKTFSKEAPRVNRPMPASKKKALGLLSPRCSEDIPKTEVALSKTSDTISEQQAIRSGSPETDRGIPEAALEKTEVSLGRPEINQRPDFDDRADVSDVAEPEVKRARLDSSFGSLSGFLSCELDSKPEERQVVEKNLFDITKSVANEPLFGQDLGSDEELSSNLSLSFTTALFSRTGNKEDNAQETANLVEKLRQQYAQKSGFADSASFEKMEEKRPELSDQAEKPSRGGLQTVVVPAAVSSPVELRRIASEPNVELKPMEFQQSAHSVDDSMLSGCNSFTSESCALPSMDRSKSSVGLSESYDARLLSCSSAAGSVAESLEEKELDTSANMPVMGKVETSAGSRPAQFSCQVEAEAASRASATDIAPPPVSEPIKHEEFTPASETEKYQQELMRLYAASGYDPRFLSMCMQDPKLMQHHVMNFPPGFPPQYGHPSMFPMFGNSAYGARYPWMSNDMMQQMYYMQMAKESAPVLPSPGGTFHPHMTRGYLPPVSPSCMQPPAHMFQQGEYPHGSRKPQVSPVSAAGSRHPSGHGESGRKSHPSHEAELRHERHPSGRGDGGRKSQPSVENTLPLEDRRTKEPIVSPYVVDDQQSLTRVSTSYVESEVKSEVSRLLPQSADSRVEQFHPAYRDSARTHYTAAELPPAGHQAEVFPTKREILDKKRHISRAASAENQPLSMPPVEKPPLPLPTGPPAKAAAKPASSPPPSEKTDLPLSSSLPVASATLQFAPELLPDTKEVLRPPSEQTDLVNPMALQALAEEVESLVIPSLSTPLPPTPVPKDTERPVSAVVKVETPTPTIVSSVGNDSEDTRSDIFSEPGVDTSVIKRKTKARAPPQSRQRKETSSKAKPKAKAKQGNKPVFQPKISSSSGALTGTVYDFDEFDDDFEAAESFKDMPLLRQAKKPLVTAPAQDRFKNYKATEPEVTCDAFDSDKVDDLPPVLEPVAGKSPRMAPPTPSRPYTTPNRTPARTPSTPNRASATPKRAPPTPRRAPATPRNEPEAPKLVEMPTSPAVPAERSQTILELQELDKVLKSALQAPELVPVEPEPLEQEQIEEQQASPDREKLNQLKFKIRGPLPSASPISESGTPALPPSKVTTTDSSAYRRMRKKELIRQYWNQNDDPVSQPQEPPPQPPPPITPFRPFNRGIMIPKAVASMGILPKEDMMQPPTPEEPAPPPTPPRPEKKKRKPRGSGMARELKNLACTMPLPGEKKPATAAPALMPIIPPSLPTPAPTPSPNVVTTQAPTEQPVNLPRPPKLKIRIRENSARSELIAVSSGNDIPMSLKTVSGLGINLSVSVTTDAQLEASMKTSKIKPPKKRRLSGSPVQRDAAGPSMEDLWRESMKFREEIEADFAIRKDKKKHKKEKRKRLESEEGSPKAKKKEKKHKKHKKEKRERESEIVCVGSESVAPKLLIRFGKREEPSLPSEPRGNSEPQFAPSEIPKSEFNSHSIEDAPKMVPLKLKLARCQDGFVTKREPSEPQTCAPNPPSGVAPLPGDCEVR